MPSLARPAAHCAAALLAALTAAATTAQAQTVYAIGNGGASLVRFNAATPGNVTVVANFGGAATFLDALDFRPATGQLYGYLDSADAFFTVNLNTAQLTPASPPSTAPTNTFQMGMDFNPTIDAVRIVTDSQQNIVFNPGTNTFTNATALEYALGDSNENASPQVIDNAYTNSFAGATTSQQYAIDYGTDTLVTIANNAGTLATVGPLGFNTGIYSGFDIATAVNGINTGYAILSPENNGAGSQPGFYTINLMTGQATLVGALGSAAGDQVYSLAVLSATIPTPATLGLALLVVGSTAVRRRRVR